MRDHPIISHSRRLLGGWLLAQVVAGLVLPMAAGAAPLDCFKPTGSSSNVAASAATQSLYLQKHPIECAQACYLAVTPTVGAGALAAVCAQCQGIVMLLNGMTLDPFAKPTAVGLQGYLLYACGTGAKELAAQELKEATCDKGPQNCCISVEKPGEDGKGKIEKEECRGRKPTYYGDCYCIVGRAVMPPDENKRGRYTFNSCEVDCTKKNGRVDVTQGIGRYQAETEGVETEININPLCYKPEDCSLDGGEFAGMDSACPAGQGKCIVPEPTIKLNSPVLGQATVTGIRGFVTLMFRFAILAAIVACAVMFVYGGFKYILGSSFFQISTAKQTMTNALVGLILTLTAVALLNTVNPATARYDKLVLYMVNRVQFATFNWCTDYKPARQGQPLKFSDSGDPPGQFLYEESKFDKNADETLCGKEYYIDGVVGQRCNGQKCEEKGKACFPCTSGGAKECGDRTKGFACVKGVITGNLRYSDGRYPTAMYVMPVCNFVESMPDQHHGYKKVEANLPETYKIQLAGATMGKAGAIVYAYAGGQPDFDEMKAKCQNNGGLRGAVLGVIYKDTQKAPGIIAGAIAGGTTGALGGAAAGPVGILAGGGGGAIVGGALGSVTFDDALIVSKADCGNKGTTLFKGYNDGGVSDKTDVKEAFYCGSVIWPGQSMSPRLTDLVKQSSMWTADELSKAFSGDAPIVCDFILTDKNAPSDPGTKLMQKCDSGYCVATDPKCND